MMKRRKRKSRAGSGAALTAAFALPMMFAQMAAASVETIARRTRLMAGGTCSPAEYRRMVQEKVDAVEESAAALASARDARGLRAAIDPFHRRVTANARRLRRTGG